MRNGMTLVATVVVTVLIGVIAVVMLPICDQVNRRTVRRAYCGNHQRQVVLAMLVYQNDQNQQWPVLPCSRTGSVTWDPAQIDGRATTVATLEYLVQYAGGELSERALHCPASGNRSRLDASHLDTEHPERPPTISRWAVLPSRDQPDVVYDWTTPQRAGTTRAVSACRPATATTTHHGDEVYTIFGDLHVGTLRLGSIGTGARTTASDGSPCKRAAINQDADNDDIFGDDGTPALPGAGSPTSAWLR